MSAVPAPRPTDLEIPPSADPPYLRGLNQAQLAAVAALDGPVLVLAGAGTGKTRVLTARIAHLVAEKRAWPSQILAVTFTNKAAREMRERIAQLIGPMAQDLWLGTFHALAARLLRRHAELVGLKASFSILDTDDQLRLIKQLIQADGLDEKRWPPRLMLGVIERWKDRGLVPDKVSSEEAGELGGGRAIALYRAYQDRLRTLNACDFGDLTLHMTVIFLKHPEVLAEYHRKFRYILVDEYQDTNVVQYLWLRLLAQGQRNLCCVGDDDQSIYGWRGAEIGNILRFEKDFPGATVVRLEQNYRSTPHILAAASGLIAKNEGRLGKTLWTDVAAGDKVRLRGVWDGEAEARLIGDEIEAGQRAGCALADMAILVRAGFQTREFEERLMTIGVPYRVVGGQRFYERAEIRDAIAYLRVTVQPSDDLAFERIVNLPRRGLGDASLQAMHRIARAGGITLVEAGRRLVETDELKPAARRSLRDLIQCFDRWGRQAATIGPDGLAEIVLDESGYTAMWQRDRAPEAPGRLENLKELIIALQEFETLEAFLEHVSLVMERNDASVGDQITLMTLHAAKGLEFDTVFLPGWEEGLFPHQRALDENGARGLEEERRLAYVGLTRARRNAHISYAANRRIHNQWQSALPSRFLSELPADHVEIDAANGVFGNAGGGWGYQGGPANVESGSRWGSNWGGGRQRGATIDGSAKRVAALPASARFSAGQRVFHQKFGYGRVTAVEGDRLDVAFEKAGDKKLIDSFVEPA